MKFDNIEELEPKGKSQGGGGTSKKKKYKRYSQLVRDITKEDVKFVGLSYHFAIRTGNNGEYDIASITFKSSDVEID